MPVGVDYVGIGPVYATSPKQLVTNLLLRQTNPGDIIEALKNIYVKSVVIGTLHQLVCDDTAPTRIQVGLSKRMQSAHFSDPSRPPAGKSPDGLAVVSDVGTPHELLIATKRLRDASHFKASFLRLMITPPSRPRAALGELRDMSRPATFSPSGTICPPQSEAPIMATSPEETEDLAKIPGGLLIKSGHLPA